MAVFNFSFSSGMSLQQMLAFEMAGQLWSSYLEDDITVNIQVTATSKLPDNVLGGALPTYVEVDVAQVKAALAADATSTTDATALTNLRLDNGFSALLEDASYAGERMTLTQAQAQALGIPYEASPDKLDGQIVMNTLSRNRQISWTEDLQRSGEIAANELDLLSVALHEVGHILGFISGVDAEAQGGVSQQLAQTTLLDLYRYSDRSTAQNSLELTRGAAAYFSLDGGQTSLANFSTGIVPLGNYIDGYQASHWGPGNAAADRRILADDLQLEGSPSESLQAFVQILFDLSFEASDGDWVDSPSRLFAPPNAPTSSSPTAGGDSGVVGGLFELAGGLYNLADALLGGLLPGDTSSGVQQTLAPPSSDEVLPTLGIMDPSLQVGDRSNISDLDLTAFDAIGYDLKNASTTNLNYSQLYTQAEVSLAAQLGIEVTELRDALQGKLPESASASSDDPPASPSASSLRDGRWQLLYNTLETTEGGGLYERRRSRYSSQYASFWQEESIDASSVQIISNGGNDRVEIILENDSLNVTQLQAIPSAPLILRTRNLKGDDANDLILPSYDQAQTLETGDGDNVAVLGKQGGEIKGGWGDDTLIVQGSKATINDLGGDNLIWTQGNKSDGQSIQTGNGNDMIYFTPLPGGEDPQPSQTRSQGLFGFLLGGLFNRTSAQPSFSSTYEVNAGSGNNLLSIQGHDSQRIITITGDGDDLISVQGKNVQITTGGGRDTVILGDLQGAYFRGAGHAQLTDFDYSDRLQLFGNASDYQIHRNQLLYQGDVIAEFGQDINFSLTDSQVIYVGPGELPSDAVPITPLSTALQSAIDRHTAEPEIQYHILGGEDANQFEIDPINGQLKFNPGVTAQSDTDRDSWFEVTVAAIQGKGGRQQTMDTQDLIIQWDHSPQISNIDNTTKEVPVIASPSTSRISDTIGPVTVGTDAISLTPTLGENLLVNGSFEDYSIENNTMSFLSDLQVGGWRSYKGEKLEVWSSGFGGVESTDGSNHLELDAGRGRDGIYQNIQTETGQIYRLTFDMRARGANINSNDESVVVEWNGVKTKFHGYHATAPNDWTTITVEVEGTGKMDQLLLRESISSGASDGTGPFLDNIQLRAVNNVMITPDTYSYGATPAINQTVVSSAFDLTQNSTTASTFNSLIESLQPNLT